MRPFMLKLVAAAIMGVSGAIAGVGYAGNDQPCSNNGCKTETVKEAGESGGFTADQQNSPNSPNPNKQGECTNPGGQPNCPHQ
jgi:hypothetical protein